MLVTWPQQPPPCYQMTRSEPSQTAVSPAGFLKQTLLSASHPETKEVESSLPAHTALYPGRVRHTWTNCHGISEHFGLQLSWLPCSLGCCRLLTGCQGNHENHISCLFTRCFHGNLRVCLELPGSLFCQWHCNKIWQTLFETILYFVEIYNLSWLLFFSLHGMRPFRKRSFWKVTMIALINWITYLGVYVLMCKPVRCGTPADVRGQHGGWILFFHHVGLNSDFSCLVASTFTR